MAFTEKDLESWRKNELGPNDTFSFSCKMCGNCCRKRREPILMTGSDIFRIAQASNHPVDQVIQSCMRTHIGDTSHLPVIVLREREDGSCALLRKGKCMVQQNKPAVCALFPLGRYFDTKEKRFHYFFNERSCAKGYDKGQVWTLQQWKDEFHLDETEDMASVWSRLMTGIAEITHKMPAEKITGDFFYVIFWALYLGYDTTLPYIPQVEHRMSEVRLIFEKNFHKKIRFS